MISLRDAPSHAGLAAGLRAHSRVDPYWGGLFSTGTTAAWSSAKSMRLRAEAGVAEPSAAWSMDEDEAWEVLADAAQRPVTLSLLGALLSWRTMTTQQAAAFAGYAPLATRSRIVQAAFAAGLVDIGDFSHVTSGRGYASALRPSGSKNLSRRFLPEASWVERMSLTAGRSGSLVGGQYDRHNLVTTELALRIAEMCDVGAVLGETMSTVDLLLGSGLGLPDVVSTKTADATIVRRDGLRIAIEVTASSAPGFKLKARQWADLLSRTSLARTGLVVLFVGAPPPDRPSSVAADMRKLLTRINNDFPGRPGDRPGDRIFFADYRDYFPAPGHVAPSLFDLSAIAHGGRPVSLLDPFSLPFAPENPDLFTAVIDNAPALAATPYWMREPSTLWTHSVRDLPGPIVHVPHRHGWQRTGHHPAGARGPVAGQKVPAPLTLPRYRGQRTTFTAGRTKS